ncbi:hypothetical protein [Sphingobacterium sp. CZ-2]|uniref:hypothetical protein n=1 Tax=Sphingobacterium sp. CZ-2 TaxID=2557994 RepID=UPI00106F2AB6|nr:hypothetical protein [Sphingobacterium sp. CZ-2]QBR10956.1 hypothetical protein E3D81_01775 [Sphingobacterium sp. CZ-2]
MSGTKSLALLNFMMVTLNFTWIILMDNSFFFGNSINTAISSYPTYLTPAPITFKIWSFLSANMILVGILMFIASRNEAENPRTVLKIKKIGNLLILNQLFCGLSMVLKMNNHFILSVICSSACLITILMINKRIEIHKLVSNSFIRYFIRLGFGVYTGWMIILMAFNSVIILAKFELVSSSSELFWLNVAVLLACTAYGIYYTITHYLPAVSAVLAWGIFGILIQNIKQPHFIDPDMKPYLYVMLFACILATLYSFYLCNVRRKLQEGFNEFPPSIS